MYSARNLIRPFHLVVSEEKLNDPFLLLFTGIIFYESITQLMLYMFFFYQNTKFFYIKYSPQLGPQINNIRCLFSTMIKYFIKDLYFRY